MKKLFIVLSAIMVVGSARAEKELGGLVLVQGGTFKDACSTNYCGKGVILLSFYIGRYEVTQKEWIEVMGSNPSKFIGDNLPVETVSWYDCVEYCNKRSIKEGLKPYYNIDKNKRDPDNQNAIDNIKWTVTINAGAKGYRLPTETEWEYAAGGGQKSRSCSYSGSEDVDKVAWYWRNAGDTKLTGFWFWSVIEQNHDKTHPVGDKEPNELGLYDMSGNVREWCWDWYGDLGSKGVAAKGNTSETGRVWRGGGWIGDAFCCKSSFRGNFEASGSGPDQGFRVCRSQ